MGGRSTYCIEATEHVRRTRGNRPLKIEPREWPRQANVRSAMLSVVPEINGLAEEIRSLAQPRSCDVSRNQASQQTGYSSAKLGIIR